MAVDRSSSILAVDFGNVTTRAVLIDVVEGAYRVVGRAETRTTAGFPAGDVSVGLRRALTQISSVTGRRLLNVDGRIITPEQRDRAGVDNFLTTASIGRPLQTVLVGLVPNVSLESALRAVAGTYVQVAEVLSLDDPRSEQEQINALVLSRPDLIFITGGTEQGAQEPVLQLARLVQMALVLMTSQRRPTVLYAGNSALTPSMQSLFDGITRLLVADNVRPTLDDEELESAQLQLALAFDASSAQRGSGFEAIGSMSRLGVMPTAQSYNLMVDYLGKTRGEGVVVVDVGSAVSTLAASLQGRVGTAIRTDIGLGHSARNLIDAVGLDAIRRWLPFAVGRDELATYTMNKTLRPGGVPETVREFYLEYALLRAGIGELIRAAGPMWDPALADGKDQPLPPFSRAIGAGGALTGTGRPALTAMLMLDALQPAGVTVLESDPAALLPALGALAHVNPAAVVQVLDTGGTERLGVAFSAGGHPRSGRTALRVKIAAGGQTITHDVEGGHLWVYPLDPEMSARVEVRAVGSGVSLGGRGSVKLDVQGGTAGLIFDARGRPLPLASDLRARMNQLPVWVSEATGDAIHEFDPAWLKEPVEEDGDHAAPFVLTSQRGRTLRTLAPEPAEAPRSRRRRGRQQESIGASKPATDEELDELRDLFS